MCTRFLLTIMLLAAPALAVGADDDLNGDPLPAGAKARLGTTRYRFGQNYTPTISTDAKTIFASDNFGLSRFELNGVPRKPYPAGSASYIPIAFSADGSRAVSAYSTTSVWDTASGKNIITLKRSVHYFDQGQSLADLSADGKILVVGAVKRDAKEAVDVLVWDVEANKEIARFVPPQNEQAFVALSPDGKIVATWGKYANPGGKVDYQNNPGREVNFWDATTGKPLAKVRVHGYATSAAAFNPDGTLAAVAGTSTIELVDPRSGESKHLLLGQTGVGRSLAFSPDGTTIFATNHDGVAQRWRTSDGVRLSTTPPPIKGLYRGSIRAAAADRGIASGMRSGNMVVWEVPSGKLLGPQDGHFSSLQRLRVTPDSKFVLTSAYDGQSLKWELATGKLIGPAPGHPWPGRTGTAPVEFAPGGVKALIHDTSSVAIHDGVSGVQEFVIPTASTGFPRAAFSGDGSKVITTENSGDAKKGPASVTLWDVAQAKRLHVVKMPDFSTTLAALTPDGKHVVTVSRKPAEKGNGVFFINAWSLPGGAKVSEFSEEAAYGNGAVAIGDNTTAAVVTSKNKLLRFDIATGDTTPIATIDPIGAAPVFSADGKLAAVLGQSSFGRPAPVIVLDWATGKTRQTIACPDGGPTCAAFSPDGRHLVTGTNQATALVWELTK